MGLLSHLWQQDPNQSMRRYGGVSFLAVLSQV